MTFDAEGSDVAFCVEKEGIPGGIAGKIGILLAAAGALAVLLHGIMKKKRNRTKEKLRSRINRLNLMEKKLQGSGNVGSLSCHQTQA